MGKWIKFFLKEKKEKTNVYDIISTYDQLYLGQVRWFPRWRKYAFFPNIDTVWEEQCLADIIEFLNQLKEERKCQKK